MSDTPRFFVSYSRDDSAYADRLVDHLRRLGLPMWIDRDLPWGSRFTPETRQRIQDAIAMIVVMSPSSETSDWVEREILEGQRHDRHFLPILLRGERLFLLASSNYFDARAGVLPGEAEIAQLRRLHRDGGATPAGVTLPAPADPPREVPRQARPRLDKLREALSVSDLAYADILTTSLLLDAAGRLDRGWLRPDDGRRLDPGLLDAIDACWSAASGGRHGFRAQLARHSAAPRGAPAGRAGDFAALARAVGWKEAGRATPRYGEFVARGEHHEAFYPTLRNPQRERHLSWHDDWAATVMVVHLRLRNGVRPA